MRKIARYGICGMAAMMLLAGCTKKEADVPTEATTEVTTESNTEPGTESAAASELIPLADYGTIVLGEYKGLEVEGISEDMLQERIDQEIKSILADNPEYVEVTGRPSQLGDVVNIDYVGLKGGEAFEGGTDQGYDLELGSQSFIEGFEAGLVGYNKGDEVSLNLTFPEDYPSQELAGQDVVFEVTINSVEEATEAEFTDDFVLRVSDYASADEFLAALTTYKESEARNEEQAKVLQMAIDNAEITCNPDAVEQEFSAYYQSYENQAAQYGVSMDVFVSFYGTDVEGLKQQLQIQAEQFVKQQLLVQAIAEAEGLAVEADDLQQVAENNNAELDALVQAYGQEAVDQVALTYKVVKFLGDNAAVK